MKIPADQRDPELPEKLKAEWPGILKWMIEGCLEWQRKGLAAPTAVTDATNEYFETEDALGIWLKECCDTDKSFSDSGGKLFSSWCQWAARAGEFPGSQKRFSQNLSNRGFEKDRSSAGTFFKGIFVRPPSPSKHEEPPPYGPEMQDM